MLHVIGCACIRKQGGRTIWERKERKKEATHDPGTPWETQHAYVAEPKEGTASEKPEMRTGSA